MQKEIKALRIALDYCRQLENNFQAINQAVFFQTKCYFQEFKMQFM